MTTLSDGDTLGHYRITGAIGAAGWGRCTQLSIPLDPAGLDGRFAVSPDGSRVAFVGREQKGDTRLYVRALAAPDARLFPGSEDHSGLEGRRGRWLAFDAA